MNKITTIEEGRDALATIDAERRQILFEMQQEDSIVKWRKLADRRYALKRQRVEIQSQMLKFAAIKAGHEN